MLGTMSEIESGSESPEKSREKSRQHNESDRPESPPTPFDHPLFLPVLLVAGMLWFGYDGWINQDPDMLEHRDFNRYGFGVLTLAAAWFGRKGWIEWRQDRAEQDGPKTP